MPFLLDNYYTSDLDAISFQSFLHPESSILSSQLALSHQQIKMLSLSKFRKPSFEELQNQLENKV